jgi:hypothetical protein
MMIKQIVLYARKHAKLFLSTEVITCVILFVVGSTVGHAIAVGMS